MLEEESGILGDPSHRLTIEIQWMHNKVISIILNIYKCNIYIKLCYFEDTLITTKRDTDKIEQENHKL